MKRRKLVMVSWNDACELPDGEGKPVHKPKVQHTVGFMLKSNKKGVSLATEWNDDGTGWRGENFIPRGMVRTVRRLKIGKKL
jgi:hypothetical protein